MEFMMGLFVGLTGFLMIPWVWGTALLAAILFDYNEKGFLAGLFTLLTFCGLFFFFRPSLDYSLTTFIAAAIGYIGIGFVYSFYRFFRFTNGMVEAWNNGITKYKDIYICSYNKSKLEEELALTEHVSRISYWIAYWPVSFITNLLADLIDLLQTAITKFFRGIYERISKSAVAKIKDK